MSQKYPSTGEVLYGILYLTGHQVWLGPPHKEIAMFRVLPGLALAGLLVGVGTAITHFGFLPVAGVIAVMAAVGMLPTYIMGR